MNLIFRTKSLQRIRINFNNIFVFTYNVCFYSFGGATAFIHIVQEHTRRYHSIIYTEQHIQITDTEKEYRKPELSEFVKVFLFVTSPREHIVEM